MPSIDAHDRPALLEARRLAFARNDEPIFGPLDFSLHAGEVVLIEGDNGAGKTTLLRVLSGLLAPTSGEIRLDGEPLTLARLSPQLALLSHQSGLKPELSAHENLRFAAGLHGLRKGMSPTTALAGVGLDGYADVPTRRLSAGQKKRVALARVLLAPVGLWLLDEPYANLDLDGIKLVNRLLERHANGGGAALITSHGAYAYTSGTPRRIPLRPTRDAAVAVGGGRLSREASSAIKSIAAEAAPTKASE
ncbi:MAG: heme ABC exporter ATP-binding protein CcmA [Lysobacterales bacterium]